MPQKKVAQAEKPKTVLVIPLDEAVAKISNQIDKGSALLATQIGTQEQFKYRVWHDYTNELLKQIFNTEERANEFSFWGAVILGRPKTLRDEISELQRDIHTSVERLISIRERLSLYPTLITTTREPARPIELVEQIVRRFHLVTRQLRQRHDNRATLDVTDEYDVQDLLHSLLKIFFDDVRPEEWTPSYAGGTSRMDFLLKDVQIVVEVKKTRPGLGAKEIGSQLLVDIGRYQAHSDCRSLLCFVYDPDGHIVNRDGLERDLSHPVNGMNVRVVITPKGL